MLDFRCYRLLYNRSIESLLDTPTAMAAPPVSPIRPGMPIRPSHLLKVANRPESLLVSASLVNGITHDTMPTTTAWKDPLVTPTPSIKCCIDCLPSLRGRLLVLFGRLGKGGTGIISLPDRPRTPFGCSRLIGLALISLGLPPSSSTRNTRPQSTTHYLLWMNDPTIHPANHCVSGSRLASRTASSRSIYPPQNPFLYPQTLLYSIGWFYWYNNMQYTKLIDGVGCTKYNSVRSLDGVVTTECMRQIMDS